MNATASSRCAVWQNRATKLAANDLDRHFQNLGDLKDRVSLADQAGSHVVSRAVNVLVLDNHKLKVTVTVLRDRARGMATRVQTLAHGLDRGRQIEQRIEHSLAAIHHVLRQRQDIGHGKDMAAGRDA